jgi:D-erythronate 2-dehydrogenase
MKVIITGGAGFIGSRLAKELLHRGHLIGLNGQKTLIKELVIFDMAPPQISLPADKRMSFVTGDISSIEMMKQLIDKQTTSIFHFAGVVSGQAESDLDLGMRINIDGTRAVLDACRAHNIKPRIVFASSISVYGDHLPAIVTDDTPTWPSLSYGAQKLCCEYIIDDYTRRGLIDGRSVRIPTVVIRPGKPNKGVGQWTSSFFREPLTGKEAICPVSKSTVLIMLSIRRLVESIIHIHDVPGEQIGPQRALLLPALSASVADMIESLQRVGGDKAVKCIRWEPDAFIQRVQDSWPHKISSERSKKLGIHANHTIDEIIQEFIEDDLENQKKFNAAR